MACRGRIFREVRYNRTVLEQMLSEITYHRSRDANQCGGEESGIAPLNSTTFWTDLFIRHFLYHAEDQVRDDMLFFVRKQPKEKMFCFIPQFEKVIEVFRKDSRKLPIADTDIDWEETLYLNLILHQFEYTLTCAICIRTSSKNLQVLRRHSQRVYASPSRRSMDCKGEGEEISYPNIFFMVDNYDEVSLLNGEMVCVELVAMDKDGVLQGVIFLGSIQYEALKRVYDTRASITMRMAQRMFTGWYQGHQRMEFVRMRGPQGNGHAEMAVTRVKGTGADTHTSEPGFSLTENYNYNDLEENPYLQRRMSDPSSNLNTFVRGWRTKEIKRSLSEREGVGSFDNGGNEIEAGDLRDELDDTTYNKLWTIKGFGQAYHFWKDSNQTNSPALNAYLTYVTLPWHHIVGNLLDTKQEPILTS
ncbi:uncharacterized protein KIAA0930 homolog [Limulus polyphemus]|uniref:Uncharacterized protein KIAA0930 homolog n=1 Tax=Limulus polyphemus TaxID=6850 RepID=A0ABM1T554_LIMPO|nr:uncharacterized protein KIAA0930 homolog [Limulus polyphemus]